MQFSSPSSLPGRARARTLAMTAGILVGISTGGCGGGGGSSGDFAVPPPAPSVPPVAISETTFINVSTQAGLIMEHQISTPSPMHADRISGGVAAADYDADGFIDIYVVGGNGSTPNRLYRNSGNGRIEFVEVGIGAGVALVGGRSSGPIFGDLNGDTFPDLFVGSVRGDPVHVFINQQDGSFADVTASTGLSSLGRMNTFSAALADFDIDGDLDLALSHWDWDETATNLPPIADTETLWANDGDSTFTNVTIASGLASAIGYDGTDYSFTPNFADIDNDGFPDLLMASDFGTSQVFVNNRDGTYSDKTSAAISVHNGMGAAIGDYDNDGDLDWFVTAIASGAVNNVAAFSGNGLYRNDGDGSFSDVTDDARVRIGGWGWGSCFADFNNDGILDIFHVNGWSDRRFTDDLARLFMANGTGSFDELALESGITTDRQGRGLVCADFDRDGDIDIFIFNNGDFAEMYENTTALNRSYLTVVLKEQAEKSQAIGARVYATSKGGTQMREIALGSNFVSHNPAEAHFGLGDAVEVTEVMVVWPSGGTSTLNNVPVNQLLVIEE